MAAPVRTPRQAWVDAALAVLAEEGVDGVRVEPLAARLNVTKGGFYGHFANRAALLEAVLEEWERRATTEVLTQVGRIADLPTRLRTAGALTFSPELLPIDLAVRAWARRDAEVGERLRAVDNRRIGLLRELFSTYVDDPDEVEARSTLAFAAAIGGPLMAADHPGFGRETARELATEFVVGRPEREG